MPSLRIIYEICLSREPLTTHGFPHQPGRLQFFYFLTCIHQWWSKINYLPFQLGWPPPPGSRSKVWVLFQPCRVIYFVWSVIPSLKSLLSVEAQSNIVQIAGYVKYLQKDKWIPIGTAKSYDKFTTFLSLGGVTFPGVNIVQWTAFTYLLFDCFKEQSNNLVSDFYEFEINHSQIRMMVNTFLTSFCKSSTPLRSWGKKQCKKLSNFPKKLICVLVTVCLKELYKLSILIWEIFMFIVE